MPSGAVETTFGDTPVALLENERQGGKATLMAVPYSAVWSGD